MKNAIFNRKQLAVPYMLFLLLFVILPLLVVVYYGFTDAEGHISLANFIGFFANPRTLGTLILSVHGISRGAYSGQGCICEEACLSYGIRASDVDKLYTQDYCA